MYELIQKVYIVHLSTEFNLISKHSLLRPNKEISVFRVTGLKILGRVGTHFFLEKYMILCILKGENI